MNQARPGRVGDITVRRASEDDLPGLTRMLGRAFLEDPLLMWACRAPALRPAVLDAIHLTRLRQLMRFGEIWIAPGSQSAALWLPPGARSTKLLDSAALARGLLRPRLLARLPRLVVALGCMQHGHPSDRPHWYLSKLGTDPDHQGHGLASAVLRPVLDRCDSQTVGAYLETSTQRNVDFYARHGFHITGERQLPRGPQLWTMWREPSIKTTTH